MLPRCFSVPPLSGWCRRCPQPGSATHFDFLFFLRSGNCGQKYVQNVCLDCTGMVGLHVHPSRKDPRNGAKNHDLLNLFGHLFLGGAKLLPRGVHGVPRGRPGVPKGRPGRARCRRWPAKKCQRDATESKRLPRGTKRLPRQCPMLPIGFQSVLKGCPGIPKGRTETKSRAKEPSDKHGTTNRQRLGQGENLRWMLPRCFPDASQFPPYPGGVADALSQVPQRI